MDKLVLNHEHWILQVLTSIAFIDSSLEHRHDISVLHGDIVYCQPLLFDIMSCLSTSDIVTNHN